MSARDTYSWKTTDNLWAVAARFLDSTGYSNTITLAEAIRAANPRILDWTSVPAATPIFLPSVLTSY